MNRPTEDADDFETTVQLCIDACEAALIHGTPQMQAIARLLLLVTGQAVAEQNDDA